MAICREFALKFIASFREFPSKMPKRRKPAPKQEKALDTLEGKRGRGRPARVRASEIAGRAYNYRLIFSQNWNSVGEPLLKAKTEGEVIQVFEKAGPYMREFVPIAPLILKVLHDPEFPKRRETQINFLADSLAGYGWISPRHSRNICERERAKEKHATHIIRYEFKIECSCGFKGFSRDHACPECKAKIPFPSWFDLNSGLF